MEKDYQQVQVKDFNKIYLTCIIQANQTMSGCNALRISNVPLRSDRRDVLNNQLQFTAFLIRSGEQCIHLNEKSTRPGYNQFINDENSSKMIDHMWTTISLYFSRQPTVNREVTSSGFNVQFVFWFHVYIQIKENRFTVQAKSVSILIISIHLMCYFRIECIQTALDCHTCVTVRIQLNYVCLQK